MKFLYVNTRNIYPHDRHLIDGMKENGHIVSEFEEKSPGLKKYFTLAKRLFSDHRKYDAVFVGFTSPLFVPIVWLFSKEKIIFNATSSQYEANIVSRNAKVFSFQALKWWLIDFISFHLAWRILLESQNQVEYVRQHWLMSYKKLVRSWSGLNEKEFFYDPSIPKNPDFTVLFRGRFLSESGIDTVLKTAKILENSDIKFLIIGHGFMYKEVGQLLKDLHPQNIEHVTTTIPIQELRKRMRECQISLGQMADHLRLDRTLPCKSFESLAMRLPYLTGRNKAILELLEEDTTCLCSDPGDPEDLAKKILYLRGHPEILDRVAGNGYEYYKNNLTSKHLATEVLNACFPKI